MLEEEEGDTASHCLGAMSGGSKTVGAVKGRGRFGPEWKGGPISPLQVRVGSRPMEHVGVRLQGAVGIKPETGQDGNAGVRGG